MTGNGSSFVALQLLVNELRSGKMRITDLDLVMMDECHHTYQCHPYAAIMEHYYAVRYLDNSAARLPQIVGLTASLGVGSFDFDPAQHYLHICANLDCDLITHVQQNREELERYVPPLKQDQILAVNPSNRDTPFYKYVVAMVNEILRMKEMKDKVVAFDFGSQPFENWAVQVRSCVFAMVITLVA